MPLLAVIWRAGGLLFATGVSSVVEVLPPLSCPALPAAPAWMRGLFRYRGGLIPLIDVHELMGLPRPADRMANRILVVRCADALGESDFRVGLWVDTILELERLDSTAPDSHPGLSNDSTPFLGAVVQTRFGQVQFVNPESLLTAEQTELLAGRMKEAAA